MEKHRESRPANSKTRIFPFLEGSFQFPLVSNSAALELGKVVSRIEHLFCGLPRVQVIPVNGRLAGCWSIIVSGRAIAAKEFQPQKGNSRRNMFYKRQCHPK